uniref:Dynactin subunit 3 n=1 Tax=Pseudonaja textilis TaxID=8673 RepID=A0A670ZRW7_PSETE
MLAGEFWELKSTHLKAANFEKHCFKPTCMQLSIADGLSKVQGSLGNIASKRERVKILFKKIEDILKYLDPQYIDRMAMPDAMKLQFILAGRSIVGGPASILNSRNKSLASVFFCVWSLAASPDHATKLQRLSQIHLQQQVSAELGNISLQTLLLSKQFVQWDEMLTQLEAAKQVKPTPE